MRTQIIAIAATLLSVSIARADEAAPPPPPPPPGPPAAAATAPVPAPSAYPEAMADRPYNLNGGMLELHAAMPIFAVGTNSSTEILLGVGASYGVSDLIEIGGDYALALSPKVDAAGFLAGHVKVRLVHNEQMSASIGAAAFYSDSLSNSGVILLAGGVSFRYRLNKQLSIFTDTNLCGNCINIAGPVMGQALVAVISGSGGSNGETIAGFTIPAGVGFQATPQLYLSASTIFGAILLSPQSESYFLLRDAIPIVASAWYGATPTLDLGATLTDDVKNAGDNYFVEFGAKARF